jgi:hypothetical protein
MKRTEVSLFRNGKPTRGILEQFEATDQTFVTSGNADGTTSTLNFTNSTGGTFTVTNSNLLFNTGGGGVTDVTGTAPVVSSGGDTPAISVTTAAVTNGSVNLSTGDQIYDFVAGFTAPAANRVVVTADEGTDATMYPTFVSAAGTVPLYNYGTLTYNPGDANLSSTNFTGALAGNASTSTKIASITNTDIVQLGSTQTLTNKTLTSPTITGPDITGTANLDAVDIDGNVQLDGTLTVGVDDTGYDVKFFGATAGKYMLWDEDQDSLFFPDDTKIVLGTGSDTEIQQTGSETIIKDASTGNIKLRAGTVTIQNGAASKTMAVFNGANSVDLHYNNTKKFETTNTGIEVTGVITGAKSVLRSQSFYVNANPFVHDALYFGHTTGNQPNNWNDAQPIGGDPMTVASFTINDDDQAWGMIVPFDISKIEILCGLRPGGTHTDQFSLVLYTASRVTGAVTSITLTRVAQNGVNFDGSGRYTNNDLTHTANIDAGTMIYVGVGTNTAVPVAKNAKGYMSITITHR